MIQLLLDIDDISDGSQRAVMLPCSNLSAQLPSDHEYVIISSFPDMGIWLEDDIWKLNNTLDEINCENPEMTADYLGVLVDASGTSNFYSEEFLRRVKENDFMFCDITNIDYDLGTYGNAACYLLSEHRVPFWGDDVPVTAAHELVISAFQATAAKDFVDWHAIWDKYYELGFRIIDWETDTMSKTFVVFW